MLAAGKLIGSQYSVIECVGEGGGGSVYRCKHVELGRELAVKLLHSSLVMDNESLERFHREARILCGIKHPNVAVFYQVGLHENAVPYIAMEFLSGRTLQEEISQRERIPWQEVISLGLQMCAALNAIHQAGVVHRDVKPGNFMLTADNTIKLVDFGLARASGARTLTDTGLLIGTVHYMSPEACVGAKTDCRSDIYALGCSLYAALYGRPPFDADSPIGILHLHTKEPPSFEHAGVDVPTAMVSVIARCLAKDGRDRYQSVKDLVLGLEGVASGPGDFFRAEKSRRRFGRTAMLCGGALAVGIVILVCFATTRPQSHVEIGREFHGASQFKPSRHLEEIARNIKGAADLARLQHDRFLSMPERCWIIEEYLKRPDLSSGQQGFGYFCLARLQEYNLADKTFETAEKLLEQEFRRAGPDNLESYSWFLALGGLQFVHYDDHKAKTSFLRAFAIVHNGLNLTERVDCCRSLADIALLNGNIKECDTWLDSLIDSFRSRAQYPAGFKYNVGDIEFETRVMSDRLSATFVTALIDKGRCALLNGNSEEARKYAKSAMRCALEAEPEQLLHFASYLEAVDCDSAQKVYQAAIHRLDGELEKLATISMAYMLVRQKKIAAARELIRSLEDNADYGAYSSRFLMIRLATGPSDAVDTCLRKLKESAQSELGREWLDSSFALLQYYRDKSDLKQTQEVLRSLGTRFRELTAPEAVKVLPIMEETGLLPEAADGAKLMASLVRSNAMKQRVLLEEANALASMSLMEPAIQTVRSLAPLAGAGGDSPLVAAPLLRFRALYMVPKEKLGDSIQLLKRANEIYRSNGLRVYRPRRVILEELVSLLKKTRQEHREYEQDLAQTTRNLRELPPEPGLPFFWQKAGEKQARII